MGIKLATSRLPFDTLTDHAAANLPHFTKYRIANSVRAFEYFYFISFEETKVKFCSLNILSFRIGLTVLIAIAIKVFTPSSHKATFLK